MAFPPPTSYRPPITGRRHMIASGHYLATAAGARILDRGGNAIDAGVAAGFCINVVQPDMTNIGGVAPILIYDAASKRVSSISGLGSWPAATDADYFRDECDGAIPPGVRRCVIPAAIDSWLTALERWGARSLEQVLEPAIDLARNGFPVYPFLEASLTDAAEQLSGWPESAATYLPGGSPPGAGTILKQPRLAETLERLVDEERTHRHLGREAAIRAARNCFYRGAIAEKIDAFMRDNDGWMTADDLASFAVEVETPPRATYRGLTVHGCGPWCQGPALLQTLSILDGFDLKAAGAGSADQFHLILEALKAAFADRDRYVADPRFVDVPLQGLLSPEYAETWRSRVDRTRAADGMPEAGDPWPFEGRDPTDETSMSEPRAFSAPVEPDTSYVCVVDSRGNAFSATPSDGVTGTPLVPELGFVVSPRGVQSWLDPDHPAAIAPGKRPRLTPNPAMITVGDHLVGPFGTPGNDTQPQAMVQFLVNLVDNGMNPQQAVEAPRIATYSFPRTTHPHPYEPNHTQVEERLPADVIDELRNRGHDVRLWPEFAAPAGSICAILVDPENGILTGAADPRRLAYAIGW